LEKANLTVRVQTVENVEMEAYVRATVMNEQGCAEEQEEPVVMRAGDSIARVVRRRMQAYMHDLFSLSDRPTLNPTWPAWVLKVRQRPLSAMAVRARANFSMIIQRLDYLFGSLSLVIKGTRPQPQPQFKAWVGPADPCERPQNLQRHHSLSSTRLGR
jgi:hypothetical protein